MADFVVNFDVTRSGGIGHARGRCAVARCALGPGCTVLREDACATALFRDELGRRCDYSLQIPDDGQKLLKSKVTAAAFRSRVELQAAQRLYHIWEERAVACSSSSSANVSHQPLAGSLPTSGRLALRSLWRALAEDGQMPWQDFQDHWEDIEQNREEQLCAQAAVIRDEFARSLRGGSGNQASNGCTIDASAVAAIAAFANDIGKVARLLAAIDINAMVITDEEQRPVALGLFVRGSAFNHDEEPNCVQSFVGRHLVVRTIRPVAIGEELTISYSELAEVSRARRAKLQSQYFFDPLPRGTPLSLGLLARDELLCEVAQLCTDGNWRKQAHLSVAWNLETGVQCSNANDEAVSLVRRVHAEWSAASRLLSAKSDERTAAKQLRKAWDLCTASSRSKAEPGTLRLGECHALRVQVARDGLDAAVAAERWNDATVYARATAAAHQRIYPEFWPVTGLSLARLAKLEMYHCRFGVALQAGKEALRILAVACDDRIAVAAELRQLMAQGDAELAVARETGRFSASGLLKGGASPPAVLDASYDAGVRGGRGKSVVIGASCGSEAGVITWGAPRTAFDLESLD
eukprot:TRINITY_DN75094_c0_g1_i1.p1 TRINITY_DN75094_c0_g1~~TRINITY_DN75094_c0_g1_i1.p1  ORF type:complete len:579 (-),score=87.25 TRINITY_DN75094_c0_g1_i1:130-1866(-)